MKKIIFLIFGCLMAISTGLHAQNNTGKIFLEHGGSITQVFNNSGMQKAIDAASAGDVIYLSKGEFNGGFTINKSISIVGSGADATNYNDRTRFNWAGNGVTIGSEENNNSLSLEISIKGVYFDNSVYLRSGVANITITKCYFQNGLSTNSGYSVKKIILDRSRFNGIDMYSQIEDLTAKNCKFYRISGQGGTTTASCKFVNCNIYTVETNTKAMIVNSIVNQVGNGTTDYLNTNTILVNTLYHSMNGYDPMEKASQQDCYSTTETLITNNNDYECAMTKDQLQAAGYLGVDGTVVGIEGGVNPYSLTLHAPSVTSKGANVDLNNKKVTINVTATAN